MAVSVLDRRKPLFGSRWTISFLFSSKGHCHGITIATELIKLQASSLIHNYSKCWDTMFILNHVHGKIELLYYI